MCEYNINKRCNKKQVINENENENEECRLKNMISYKTNFKY